MQKPSKFVLPFAAVFGALAMSLAAGQASATYIIDGNSPGTLNTDYWTCDSVDNKGSITEINTCFGTTYATDGSIFLLYKKDFDSGAETGTVTGSYDTTFGQYEEPGKDPSSATITYLGGVNPYIDCPTCFLIVKDGENASPKQWLFDINDWDGKDTISIINMWEDAPGAISNVAIWGDKTKTPPSNGNGGPPTGTPEPGIAALLGIGLLGQALILRNRRRRQQ